MSPTRMVLVSALTLVGIVAPGRRADSQIVYPFPPYRTAFADSSVRVDVTPRDAEVFVDGYYAGMVDDFDGMWQRLHVEPGQHEIAIYRDGYRTHRERVYLARDRTFTIRTRLEPLAPGETGEGRPAPLAPPSGGVQPARPLPRGSGTSSDESAPARLSIRVQPADADVLIDGQPALSSPGPDAVIVDVSEGRHVIQVRKAGFVGYLTEVEVRRGETRTVDVMLRPRP